MSSKKLGIFNYLSKPFVKLVEKYYPDAFIFVIVLSNLTAILPGILVPEELSITKDRQT